MKQLIPGIAFLFFYQNFYGQLHKLSYDSSLIIDLRKNVGFPYNNNGTDSSGVALIRFFKNNDSLFIRSLYSSDNRFILENDKALIQRLNFKYKATFPNGYNVIIPLYFDYYKQGESDHYTGYDNYLKREIKKLGNKIHVLMPVTIAGNEPVR